MPSTFTATLKTELMADGEKSGTWDDITNTNLELMEEAIVGVASHSMPDSDDTLTVSNGSTAVARHAVIQITGAITATRNLIVPTAEKPFVIYNNTSGGFAVTVKTSAGTGISVPNGSKRLVYCDGTNVVDMVTDLPATTSLNGSTIVTLTATQTLTNKTLTAPTISAPTITGSATAVDLAASGNVSAGGTLGVTGATTLGSTLAITGATTATGGIAVDTITEITSANGVTIDGAKIKDGRIDTTKGSDIASATTTDISNPSGNYIVITGTTTITGLGTATAGTIRLLRFSGALTLTHNATSLILPTGANITTVAGDVFLFVSEGSGNWRCGGYVRSGGWGLADMAASTKAFDIPFAAGYAANWTPLSLIVQTYGEMVISRSIIVEGEVGYIGTPSTGQAVIVDIEKNGATIYSSKPQFAATSNSLTAGTLSATTFASGDRLTFKVTQIGSGTAGAELRFTLKTRLA